MVDGGFDLASEAAVVKVDVPLGGAATVLALMRSGHLRSHGDLRSAFDLTVAQAFAADYVAVRAQDELLLLPVAGGVDVARIQFDGDLGLNLALLAVEIFVCDLHSNPGHYAPL